jgi:hypothetical protein
LPLALRVADLCTAVNQNSYYVAPEVQRRVDRFVSANVPMWRNRLVGEPIDAMLLTARVPARLESTGHLVLGTSVQVAVLTAGSEGTDSAEFCQQAARAYMAAQAKDAEPTP